MAIIYYKSDASADKEVSLLQDESVLDGLLREGVEVPNGCRSGVCQSCIMQSDHADIPKAAQKGLRDVQKQQGYFLSCCCKPDELMTVSLSNLYKKEQTTVIDKAVLAPGIVRLRVKKVMCYRPGQYMTLWKDESTARSYSLASHPTRDDFLEFHIRIYDDGVFSPWVIDELGVGDTLAIQGPMGDCFYVPTDKKQSLFLVGLGTGLAPLYGIARDALSQGHVGDIVLLVGARAKARLYYQDELAKLESEFDNFRVTYSVQDIDMQSEALKDQDLDIYALAKTTLPDLVGFRVYLCGADTFVRKMKKQCFLSGANMGDIHSDAFLSFTK